MADITSRVQKKAAELLEAGERVTAALLVEPKGTYGTAVIALAALPRTAMRRLATGAEAAAERSGLAATFPSSSCIVATTDRRVVVIPSNGIAMKEIAVSYASTDLTVTENAGKGLGRRVRLTFVDGTSVVVDAQRGQPFEEFSAALG